MKRTPIARKTGLSARQVPLKRKKRVEPKRKERRRSARIHDPEWMLRVKELPCALAFTPEAGDCSSVVEADHVGERGLGQKSSDRETIPLCTQHHRERTDFSGYFRSFDQARMRIWCEATLRITVQMLRGGPPKTGRPLYNFPIAIEDDAIESELRGAPSVGEADPVGDGDHRPVASGADSGQP